MSPMGLKYCCFAFFVVRGVLGWSIWFILRFICSGFRSESSAISGCSFVVVLHSFLSFASRPICVSPAREIGDLSCMDVGVSCLDACIGHILVAMSW
jgi:hypothetical protein